jgi:protein SCO1/2
MDPSRRPLQSLVWGALLATIFGVTAAFVWSQLNATPELPVISQVPDFTLTNQFSQPVTKSLLEGHVTLADIIFTQCAGPCPEMTRQMSKLQRILPPDPAIRLVTLTTDPGFDKPEVLKQYGSRFDANFNRWSFLTGPKREIARVAVDGLKLIAEEKAPNERIAPEDLFIHSTIFVIVDKQARVRGSFDSSEPDFDKRVRAAVKKLLKEKGP